MKCNLVEELAALYVQQQHTKYEEHAVINEKHHSDQN